MSLWCKILNISQKHLETVIKKRSVFVGNWRSQFATSKNKVKLYSGSTELPISRCSATQNECIHEFFIKTLDLSPSRFKRKLHWTCKGMIYITLGLKQYEHNAVHYRTMQAIHGQLIARRDHHKMYLAACLPLLVSFKPKWWPPTSLINHIWSRVVFFVDLAKSIKSYCDFSDIS